MTSLGDAWARAEATLPDHWRLSLLKLDLVVDGEEHWLAAAVEYDATGYPLDSRGDEHYEKGWGANPVAALLDLAEKLR